jgi:hypothetical protein
LLDDSGTAQLVQWASAIGITTENVTPASFNGLRGLMAVEPLAEDATVITLPREAAITLAPTAKFPHADFCAPDIWSKAPWYMKLGVKLLYEKHLGEASKFQQYIAQLPRAPDMPVDWEEAELQQLQYPHLIQQVGHHTPASATCRHKRIYHVDTQAPAPPHISAIHKDHRKPQQASAAPHAPRDASHPTPLVSSAGPMH